MTTKKFSFTYICIIITILIIISILINLNTGFINLSYSDFFNKNNLNNDIAMMRVNRVWTILIAGISIPISGFLLQEYFKNPLAGPSVLGITSMASMFAAFYILISKNIYFTEFIQNSITSIFAIIGSIIALFILLFFAKIINNSSYIIILGFLISALSGNIINILQFYAESESIKNYILWTMGGNNHTNFYQNIILSLFMLLGIILSLKIIKPLIGTSLGENYALSLGVNLVKLKFLIIITSSILSASVTAFLGPILFIGVIVPHFCRLIWNPAKLWHQWILNILIGTLTMQIFSSISETYQLPINIISSIFGIPVIFLIILYYKKY